MPGQSKGPFTIEAPLLPGLMEAFFQGYLSEDDAAIGPDGWNLSEWLLNQMYEALSFENSSVRVSVVGPKFALSPLLTRNDLAEAIAVEMLTASRMPEFEAHRAFLDGAGSSLKNVRRATPELRRQLSQMGETSLQQAFFRAMALNLEYLQKLP